MGNSVENRLAAQISALKGNVNSLANQVEELKSVINTLTGNITNGTIDAESITIESLKGRNLEITPEGLILTADKIVLDGKTTIKEEK